MRENSRPLLILALLATLPLALAAQPAQALETRDTLIANFDGATYSAGWTTTGTAFGNGPAHGALPNQMAVSGYEGAGLVDSYYGTDSSVGTLTSPTFTLTHHYLSFLIGGGRHTGQEEIQLLVGGKVVRRATGLDSETLSPMQWDIADLRGKTATIQIVDTATGGWGHICVDSIKLSDTQLPDERTLALQAATQAVRRAIPQADKDGNRPAFHFHAPAQWMNDPNGPIYYGGWYHVFYQFNPYGSKWGNMHWGHARSKDLVNWQDMPVALWPSRRDGEEHVYSGSVFPSADGTAMAFYTSIGAREPEQWAAVATDKNLLSWRKETSNPVVSAATRGGAKFAEWRDPFLFAVSDKTYMVTGGGENGHGIVALYQASDGGLTHWKYRGVIFTHPDAAIHNIECPNLAKVDGKWVLLTSTYGKVESFVGQLDVDKAAFTVEKRGVLDDGSYASQLLRDAKGQLIHLAWMHTESGKGWNGYMTLPSVLHIASDGTLLRNPLPAVSQLQTGRWRIDNLPISGPTETSGVMRQISGLGLEIVATIDMQTATSVTLKLRASADGTRAIKLRYDAATRKLTLDGHSPIVLPMEANGHLLKLHVFVDRSAIDVYAADGAVTESAYFDNVSLLDRDLQIGAEGGTAKIVRMDAVTLKPATFNEALIR